MTTVFGLLSTVLPAVWSQQTKQQIANIYRVVSANWFASKLSKGYSDAHVLLLHLIFHQVSRTVLNFLCRLKFQIFKEHKTSGYSGFIIYPQYFTPGKPGNTIDSVKQLRTDFWEEISQWPTVKKREKAIKIRNEKETSSIGFKLSFSCLCGSAVP